MSYTTRMPDTSNNATPPPQSKKRLALIDPRSGAEEILGTVTLSFADGGKVNISLSSSNDESQQQIIDLIDFGALKERSNGVRTIEDFVTDISQMVESAGLSLKELPPGDFHIEMKFDMDSGRIISRRKPLHPYASASDDLPYDINKAIEEKFASIASKIADDISSATNSGDHDKAAAAVEAAANKGLFSFSPNSSLVDALASIDLNAIDVSKKELIRQCLIRSAHQIGRIDIASEQAEFLLQEMSTLSDAEKAELEMVIAYGAIKRSEVETAISIWRRLLKPPCILVPESRGWAWRNLSLALDPKNPETIEAAQHSADAFLEAGDKKNAATSIMVIAKALLHRSPQEAIETLNKIETLTEQEGLDSTNMRAAFHHARSNRISALGDHANALEDALKAVELRRGIFGAESELISSLYLVQHELTKLNRHDEAKAYETEAVQLAEKVNNSHFILAKRINNLSNSFDAMEADEILAESRRVENHEVTAAVQTLQAMLDPALSDRQRLSRLEACLAEQEKNNLPDEAKAPARQALVQLLIQMKQLDRAEKWLRQLLEVNPIDRNSRDVLINLMWKREEWGDAVIFLRKEIERWGEMPNLTLKLGESLLKSGNINEAIKFLTKAANIAEQNDQIKEQAIQLREEALQMGGTLPTHKPESRPSGIISREDFEQALSEFCVFIKSDKRMTFWVNGEKDYEWISNPERHGQNLLHTYLKGRFGERINVYEEISAGAGRLDIYVQFIGGISTVIELKMCGFRYSSSYAASGEGQVLHYMENRNTHLGYLVVFDSRLNDFGNKLLPSRPADQYTVYEIVCDVRPRISKR